MECILSVLGQDKTGIVAGVATVLGKNGANIVDINQTILDDIFSMTMLITLDLDKADFNTVQEKLSEEAQQLGVQIILQRKDLFESMYKI